MINEKWVAIFYTNPESTDILFFCILKKPCSFFILMSRSDSNDKQTICEQNDNYLVMNYGLIS